MFKKLRIPKLSPTITALLLLGGLGMNVFAIFKWVGETVVLGYASVWHLALFVTVISAVRTLQSGDKMIGYFHIAGVLVIAYFAKLLSQTMTGPAWQQVLYNTNLIVCVMLSANFISTLTGTNSSKVHDGAWDEDYTNKNKKNFWSKNRKTRRRREEPVDIPYEEYQKSNGGYRPPGT